MHTPATRASAQKWEKKRTLRRSPRWENRTDLGLTVRTERREALQGNLHGPAGARRLDGGPAASFLRRSRPRSPTPRAESENEKGRREKTEKGRREKRRCLVNSVPLGPTGRRVKAVAPNPEAASRVSLHRGTCRSLNNGLLTSFHLHVV